MFISFVILLLGLDPQCPLEHIDQFRYFNLETLQPYGPQPSYYSLRLTQDVNGINKQTNKQTGIATKKWHLNRRDEERGE